MVKHAGLCPRENNSGASTGRSRFCGHGRPRLRLTAWRAVWGGLRWIHVSTAIDYRDYRHLRRDWVQARKVGHAQVGTGHHRPAPPRRGAVRCRAGPYGSAGPTTARGRCRRRRLFARR
ncbi:transposase [Mycobacterium malmoense]|uniref:transposase n=1 Tax=Mycobacterium malmoense TaxID=1780 RepID=UPI003313B7E1